MAKHHVDLMFCRKQPGLQVGKLCDNHEGRCPICDSMTRPTTLAYICDECNFGSRKDKCVVCGANGSCDAYYCKECTLQEKDRDGCPKIINVGQSRTDDHYHKKANG
ncbi:putative Pre-mRNA-splicing factor ini1 [Blattamonas nauphoetae]|uniref:Pre-mRNA-splicing factor ini1 n=1 Tax=Blattamonas nauphoetae TaxID=2049346 RepID=A0ABQ9YJB2_9EUKA|nr:putative Pre-mRNA-splicing factor ini1 [Blattamonas nauphoetae]